MEWMTLRHKTHDRPHLANISVNMERPVAPEHPAWMERLAEPSVLYGTALPRILAFLDQVQARATFFVVGQDIQNAAIEDALVEVVARGHEVASRSFSYARNLRSWSKLSVAEEIEKTSQAIYEATGKPPVGFRTPGYNVDTRILQLLAERGYTYDSSVLPSLPYYVSKGGASVLSSLLSGRADRAVLAAHSLRAPLQPYRPSRWAFWNAGDRKHSLPIWEVPLGVIWGAGVPVHGALISSMQRKMLPSLYWAFRGRQQTLQLPIHAMDFMDPKDENTSGTWHKMRANMGISSKRKIARMQQFVGYMQRDYRLVTLEELAEELSASAGPTVVG